MAEFMIANMAPLMFGALVMFLLFGYPVAFALAATQTRRGSSPSSRVPRSTSSVTVIVFVRSSVDRTTPTKSLSVTPSTTAPVGVAKP